MTKEKLDILWNSVYDTYYDVYYEEIFSNFIIQRLERIDFICRLLIAITTSGSAIAGWSVWEKPGYKEIWVFICAFSAVSMIFYSSLNISRRLKEQFEINKVFSRLRIDFETFRYKVVLEDKSYIDLNKRFFELREEYAKHTELLQRQFLIDNGLKNKVKNEINIRLIESGVIEDINVDEEDD